jgi:hypothetical protein
MVKIYLLLVCTLHPEIFSLGEVIGTVPAWEEGESFPCAIIFFLEGGRVFLLPGVGWIIVPVFLLGKGRVFPLPGLGWIIVTVPTWEGGEFPVCHE